MLFMIFIVLIILVMMFMVIMLATHDFLGLLGVSWVFLGFLGHVASVHAFHNVQAGHLMPFVIFMLAYHDCHEDHLAAIQALLGDASSRRSLRSAIHHFVSLRRYEQMSVHQAMQGIRLSTVTAISSPSHGEFAYLELTAGTPCEQP